MRLFQRRHLGQAAQVPLGLAVSGGQERLDEVPGNRRAFGAPAQAEHVEVVVLDPLPGREMVLDKRGPHPRDLVRAHAGADAAAADGDAALHLPRHDGTGERRDKVRVIVVGVERARAEIDNLVPRLAQLATSSCFNANPP